MQRDDRESRDFTIEYWVPKIVLSASPPLYLNLMLQEDISYINIFFRAQRHHPALKCSAAGLMRNEVMPMKGRAPALLTAIDEGSRRNSRWPLILCAFPRLVARRRK